MRIPCSLLVVIIALLSTTTNAISTEADAGRRSLRSMKAKVQDNQVEEERGGTGTSSLKAFVHDFDFNLLDNIFLPADFKRMTKEPEFLRHMMASWQMGFMSVDDIVLYMTRLNMSEKAINQFKLAYTAYLEYLKAVAKAEKAAKLAKASLN
eukprot:jgi/Phyca11/126960/e_gw1.65.188.1